MPSVYSVRFIPVRTHADLGHQRHFQRRHTGHQLRHLAARPVDLRLGHLENRFVVHLHYMQWPVPLVDGALHCEHGELDEVGGNAVHRRMTAARSAPPRRGPFGLLISGDWELWPMR